MTVQRERDLQVAIVHFKSTHLSPHPISRCMASNPSEGRSITSCPNNCEQTENQMAHRNAKESAPSAEFRALVELETLCRVNICRSLKGCRVSQSAYEQARIPAEVLVVPAFSVLGILFQGCTSTVEKATLAYSISRNHAIDKPDVVLICLAVMTRSISNDGSMTMRSDLISREDQP